jgi:hypothetical protein
MRQNTAQVLDAVNRAKTWLTNVHKDAILLLRAANSPAQMQIANTGSLLDDMVTQATYAYIGQLDPATNQVQAGILQAHYEIQQLATINITTNIPQNL